MRVFNRYNNFFGFDTNMEKMYETLPKRFMPAKHNLARVLVYKMKGLPYITDLLTSIGTEDGLGMCGNLNMYQIEVKKFGKIKITKRAEATYRTTDKEIYVNPKTESRRILSSFLEETPTEQEIECNEKCVLVKLDEAEISTTIEYTYCIPVSEDTRKLTKTLQGELKSEDGIFTVKWKMDIDIESCAGEGVGHADIELEFELLEEWYDSLIWKIKQKDIWEIRDEDYLCYPPETYGNNIEIHPLVVRLSRVKHMPKGKYIASPASYYPADLSVAKEFSQVPFAIRHSDILQYLNVPPREYYGVETEHVVDWSGQLMDTAKARAAIKPGYKVRVRFKNTPEVKYFNQTYIRVLDRQEDELIGESCDPYRDTCSGKPYTYTIMRLSVLCVFEVPITWQAEEEQKLLNELLSEDGRGFAFTGATVS